MSRLPAAFAELEPFAETWCLATEPERWAQRQAATMGELQAFYDAAFPVAPDALAHCDRFDLAALPAEETALLQLLHSLALVSYAVEVWHQQLPVDAGIAVIDRLAEPRP